MDQLQQSDVGEDTPDTTGVPLGETFELDMESAAAKAEAWEAERGGSDEEKETEPDAVEANEQPVHEDDSSDSGAAEDDGGTASEVEADGDLDSFRAQAKKLGYTLDKGERRVTIPERHAFRDKMRADKDKLAQYEQNLQAHAQQLEQKNAKATALLRAMESDDMEGVAKAMGHDSWLALNKSYIHKTQSPQYRELEALKRREAEREQHYQAQRQQMEQEQQARQQQADKNNWLSELGTHLSGSASESVQAFSTEPDFRVLVDSHMRANYDPDTQQTISIEEASDLALADARAEYDKLARFFGGSASLPASEAIAETPVNGASVEKQTGRKPKVITQSEAADASSISLPSQSLDEDAWAKKFTKMMNEAD